MTDDAALHPEQGRLLAALTIAAMQRHGGDAVLIDEADHLRELRLLRFGALALVEHPATSSLPRCIDVYAAVEDELFRIQPACLLYSLVWKHRATPPDFHLQLVRDGARMWAEAVVVTLFAELRARDPHLLDGLTAKEK
jgi:hypothetical protein